MLCFFAWVRKTFVIEFSIYSKFLKAMFFVKSFIFVYLILFTTAYNQKKIK